MPRTYRTESGNTITLTQEIGAGGEGSVHRVRELPNAVAKIWHKRPEPSAVQKIQVMIANPTAQHPKCRITWPSHTLHDRNRRTVGFLMPYMDDSNFQEIFHYFNPAARVRLEQAQQARITPRHLADIAKNLANTFQSVHQAGHIIGDVNEKNILIGPDLTVALVDADSFQIADPRNGSIYRCEKGRDDYTPPRLQGKRFADHDRDANDDLFGLAVIIFKLIMHGVHPYASTADHGKATVPLSTKIEKQYFPYNESGHTPPEHRPSIPYQQAWQSIDFDLRHLFRRAFDPDAASLRKRPTARQWSMALDQHVRLAAQPNRPAAPKTANAPPTAATTAPTSSPPPAAAAAPAPAQPFINLNVPAIRHNNRHLIIAAGTFAATLAAFFSIYVIMNGF